MIIELTEEEKKHLRSLHKSLREKQIADRVKAILLLSSGYTFEQVEKILLLNERTLRRYIKLYEKGINNLLEWRYKGKMPKLSSEQEKELSTHLENHLYSTATEIKYYIKKIYDIDFTKDGLVITLHRLGFSYKKTRKIPAKANAKAQKAFIERYEQEKENLKDKEKLYFMDGTHPTHNSVSACGWIKKGQEKTIKSNTGRKRVNINGVYSPFDHEIIAIDSDTINSQSTIELFKKLESKHPELEKIKIICDNASYYSSHLIKEYLSGSKIELIKLPSYSPNLNLIERLWKLLKKKVINNKYYEKFSEFKSSIFDFLENGVKKIENELDTLMRGKFQILDST